MGVVITLPPRPARPKREPLAPLDDLYVDHWPVGLIPILAAQCEKPPSKPQDGD